MKIGDYRKCGQCGQDCAPLGVDWPFWIGGKPACISCTAEKRLRESGQQELDEETKKRFSAYPRLIQSLRNLATVSTDDNAAEVRREYRKTACELLEELGECVEHKVRWQPLLGFRCMRCDQSFDNRIAGSDAVCLTCQGKIVGVSRYVLEAYELELLDWAIDRASHYPIIGLPPGATNVSGVEHSSKITKARDILRKLCFMKAG